MVRKILISSLAGMAALSAMAIPGVRRIAYNDQFDVFPGKVEVAKTPATRADDASQSLDYTLAAEPYSAYRLKSTAVGDSVFLAFQIPLATAKTFAGDEITAVNITTGTYQMGGRDRNMVKDVTIFIAGDIEDLAATTAYQQKGTLGLDGFTQYSVPLTTPYKISGEDTFFVGYKFAVPNADQYYLVVDGYVTDVMYGCWVGTQDASGKVKWNNYAQDFGNLCMGCTITGSNMPADGAEIVDHGGPSYAAPGEPFEYEFIFKGTGPSVRDLEIAYTIGDNMAGTKTITFDDPIGFNRMEYGAIAITCDETAMGLPMTFKISKVNGEDFADGETVGAYVNCFPADKGFARMHLLEEGTGTWCGWCPRGMVMMEYAAKTYPDFFALAALHASGSVKDPMQASTAMAVVQKYMQSFPTAMIDRWMYLEDMSEEEIDLFVEAYKDEPAPMAIEVLKGEVSENRCIVETGVKFALDFDNTDRYRLAYYVTQNNVGPYNQTNYYSGGYYGAMGGWEREGESVSTIYNDVARYLGGGVTGYANSIPAEIKAGEVYEDKSSLPVSSVTSDEFQVIAFVVDNLTGEIANARVITVEKPSAISEIAADEDVVATKYYTLTGVEVANPGQGIYIVSKTHANGKVTASKVIIK